jgi:hypothetical protein
MSHHFDILIDASGSMGYMKGTSQENHYLLSDGSTRTDLVKKILINSIIAKLSFAEEITISTFFGEIIYDNLGNKIALNKNRAKTKPKNQLYYSGKFNEDHLISKINLIKNPDECGTPLAWILFENLIKNGSSKRNIIILSDGDDSEYSNFDIEVLSKSNIKDIRKIYFIGIAQDEAAQLKSRNLAEQTNGFYVNIDVLNYDQDIFNNMLFEFNTTITSNALKESLNIESKTVESTAATIENKIESNIIEEENKDITIEKEVNQKDIEALDLKKQVEENTKSLQLITSQLDSIVRQVSFIGKEKTSDENEFETIEDEERNRVIGYQCEKHINSIFLKNNWEKVDWLNENSEQGKPYDFEVTVNGINYFIECKGSTSNSKEFFLTKNEWLFYLANRKNYRLYFVSEINSTNPIVHRIEDLLKDMEEGKLIPCSSVNRKVKADRILFQILN